ncbi:hypothetical protein [Methanorbis rubei]|uniref:Uncharacterized protein n=1 Tax=Methanorbis rubei TaxID=3028300 RepID=A0AAE4SDH5_9EURY|nr:hypothetical protein [Methanocorpusculaceae archaeon Cs1]
MTKRVVIVFGIIILLICSIIMPVGANNSGSEVNNHLKTEFISVDVTRATPIEGAVREGSTNQHTYYVNSGSTEINIEVRWILSPDNNDLELVVISPTGQIMGRFTDGSDGNINGVIPVRLRASSLPTGTWNFWISGITVKTTQRYTIALNAL